MIALLTPEIIVQGLVLLAAVASAVTSALNRRKIQEVHLLINSRLTELVKASMAQAHAEGMAAQRIEDRIDPAVTAEAAAKVLAVAKEAIPPKP